ncbi:hypothetical protein [Bradyrhizobium sp. SZCCHNR1093]|uniref:hypothetical protein n=1 Tax=Bradyrhizobium sp. SZCCHNR1093 TaxID=3057368 RepID=UPI0028E7B60D|nr:hypothetical protein [Bradyrhizobium sp. SZCCHNR1093]
MLAAYFDDSGTHPDSPVVAFGGLLGTEEQWNVFETAWRALLENPLPGKPPLKQFHLAPLRAKRGEFEGYSLAERDRLNYLFRHVILDIGLVTFAVAVDRIAWNKLVVGPMVEEVAPPEALCFVKCVDSVLATCRFRKPGQPLVIVFDQGVRRQLEIWGRFYKSQREKYPEIAGIGFATVSEVLPLQGADLIATESYQFAQEWLKSPDGPKANPHFQDFIMRDLSGGVILTTEHIEEIIERWKSVSART